MYYQVEINTKPIATVHLPHTAATFEKAVEYCWHDVRTNRASAMIYKVPDGYTQAERVLIANLDWDGVK